MGVQDKGSSKRRFGTGRRGPQGPSSGSVSTPLDDGLRIEDDDITLDSDEPKGPAAPGGGVYFKLLLAGVVAAGLVVILVVILSSPARHPGRPGAASYAGRGGIDPAQVAAVTQQVKDLKQEVKVIRDDLEKLAQEIKRLKDLGAAAGGTVKAAALRPVVARIVDDRLKKAIRGLKRASGPPTAPALTALSRRVRAVEQRLAHLARRAPAARKPPARTTVKRPKPPARSWFGSTSAAKPKLVIHQVKANETLFRIARKYQVSVPQLRRWNKNIDPQSLRQGMKIRIYVKR
jgi:hypothetical protein